MADAFEKRLATPADWAALDDFDEEAVMASMMAKVNDAFDEAKREIAAEKSGAGGAAAAAAQQQQQKPQPRAPPEPQPPQPQPQATTAAAMDLADVDE